VMLMAETPSWKHKDSDSTMLFAGDYRSAGD
jgi:hypothetical protein